MDVKQMTYILTIAQEGGISKAAAKLFITQSALDQQLLKLEKELGTPLFYRSRTDWHPTPAGEIYLNAAKDILLIKKNAYNQIHDHAGRTTDCSQRFFSHKTAYHNRIGGIINLLEQSSKQDRKKEKQKLFPDHALCDLVYGGIFLIFVLFHIFISPQSIKKAGILISAYQTLFCIA